MSERTITPLGRSCPDWGIPNWLDQSAYGDTRRWMGVRWRWEFTRRRDDCRADFLAHKDEEEVRHEGLERWLGVKQGGRRLRPDEPGFLASVPGCREKYGIIKLPNPAIGDQPFPTLAMFARPGPALVMFPEDGINRPFKETDAVIVFDLTRPISNQLKAPNYS
jgi:hypothetical protein